MRAPYLDDGDVQLYLGDVLEVLSEMPAESVQSCITSPPYWALRDYGTGDAQVGLEDSPAAYVERLRAVFAEVRRVLRDDGTLWLNLGDCFAGGGSGPWSDKSTLRGNGHTGGGPKRKTLPQTRAWAQGLKAKDLVGIPWRVAFALQGDGWYLRSDIVWAKPNPMPESITDRPTKAHEYVFLLSKSPRYFYDAEAIKEPAVTTEWPGIGPQHGATRNRNEAYEEMDVHATRNARSVWTISTKPYSGAHFAVFPPELPERCIKAGTKPGDAVLDPFSGSGTTAWVARNLQRRAIGIDLNAEYLDLAAARLAQQSLFAEPA